VLRLMLSYSRLAVDSIHVTGSGAMGLTSASLAFATNQIIIIKEDCHETTLY